MNSTNDGWVNDAGKALYWFIEHLGNTQWEERRNGVVEYFQSVKEKIYTESEIQIIEFEKSISPIAVYDDWIAWYMYLIESLFERPYCDDPFQSVRIYPFFASIGKNIDKLKKIPGIDKRLSDVLNKRKNQPDSTLYELAVASLYCRNGWSVEFLEESLDTKTPDLKVTKENETYLVECKRLAKVNEYAEKERTEWLKRSKHLFNAMRLLDAMTFAEIVFKVPIEETDETILGTAMSYYIQSGMLSEGLTLSNKEIDFKASLLDLNRINDQLLNASTRPHSPNMIEVLIGNYDKHGNYTQVLSPSEIEIINPESEDCILNEFYKSVHEAYFAKWDCIAEVSIDKKAKDLTKMLSKAVVQIPDNQRGIIHIGYETVTGTLVEIERQKKIQSMVEKFDFGNKNIQSIQCNALQLMPIPNNFECDETTLYFEKGPDPILEDNLLFGFEEIVPGINVHWEEP